MLYCLALGLFPKGVGQSALQGAERGRLVFVQMADHRSESVRCNSNAQRDSYATFNLDTVVALFNSGTQRHPVTGSIPLAISGHNRHPHAMFGARVLGKKMRANITIHSPQPTDPECESPQGWLVVRSRLLARTPR